MFHVKASLVWNNDRTNFTMPMIWRLEWSSAGSIVKKIVGSGNLCPGPLLWIQDLPDGGVGV